MANLTRKDIQEKINDLKELYPDEDRAYFAVQIGTWFDSKDLANLAFTHEEMKQRLLDDLNTYQGMEDN